jgi:hypothetical protein
MGAKTIAKDIATLLKVGTTLGWMIGHPLRGTIVFDFEDEQKRTFRYPE